MIGPYRTGEAAVVVTADQAKAHLRVDFADDDALIADYVAAATAKVSAMTGLVLGSETWVFKVGPQRDVLPVPVAPVASVASIAYLDPDVTSQDALVADFDLFADPERPWIAPKPGKAWPVCAAREDAITVTVLAGLTALPADLKVAILMLVGHYYKNREAVADGSLLEVPCAVQSLVEPHRRQWIAA